MKVQETQLGTEHPKSRAMKNLGMFLLVLLVFCLFLVGKNEEKIRKIVPPLCAPPRRLCPRKVADLLKCQGHLEEAEAFYRKLWETKHEVLGASHPETLIPGFA